MSHRDARRAVQSAELALAASIEQARACGRLLREDTRRSATPLRVLGAGFASGLLFGFLAPLQRLGAGPRLIQFVTQIATLVGSLQAGMAAGEAAEAAEEATAAADEAAGVGTQAVQAPSGMPLCASPHPPFDPDARLEALRRAGT